MKLQTLGKLGVGVAVVSLSGLVQASGHASHAVDISQVNWWRWSSEAPPMGWFLFDFAIFLGGLVYFGGKPLSEALSQRHLTIKRAIGEAAAAHAKASAKQREYKEKVGRLDDEVRALIETSREDGALERDQMIRQARDYAARLQADSETLADQELRRARERLHATTARAALDRAAQMLSQHMTADDQQRLLEQAIHELEHGPALEGARHKSHANKSGASRAATDTP